MTSTLHPFRPQNDHMEPQEARKRKRGAEPTDQQLDNHAPSLKHHVTEKSNEAVLDIPMSTRPTEQASAAFPFLDLPKELRLLVYEQLTIRIANNEIKRDTTSGKSDPVSFTLITYSIPSILILATCRAIYFEAVAIMEPVKNRLLVEPPRLWVPYRSRALQYVEGGPLVALVDYSKWIAANPTCTLADYKASKHRQVYPHMYDPWHIENHNGWELVEDMLTEPAFLNFLEKAARQLLHCQYTTKYRTMPNARIIEIAISSHREEVPRDLGAELAQFRSSCNRLQDSDVHLCVRLVHELFPSDEEVPDFAFEFESNFYDVDMVDLTRSIRAGIEVAVINKSIRAGEWQSKWMSGWLFAETNTE